jgi:DNA-directed RNA polymerase I, II, and III subunit RPABC2
MSYFGDDDEFNNDNEIISSEDEAEAEDGDGDEEEASVTSVEEVEEVDEVVDESDNDDEDLSQFGGENDSDLEDEPEKDIEPKSTRVKKIPAKTTVYKKPENDDEDDDDDEDGEQYLQKFDKDINENYFVNFHPECVAQNYDEILSMIRVIRDKDGIIIDDLHQTIPFLTKYERARILGQRAKQINSGATPFIKVPENIIDGYIIAEMELKEKRIPFIIRRPLPNGGSEYWSLKDLEDISF